MKIVCMMVSSLDGISARDAKDDVSWSSKADKKSFVAETKKNKVVIMGRTTFEAIGRPLPERLNVVLTNSPEKFAAQQKPDLLEFVKASPSEIVAQLSTRGFAAATVIGGPRTNAAFFSAGLIDELILTIEPVLFGHTAESLSCVADLVHDVKLSLVSTEKLGDNVMQLRYSILK